MTTMSDPVRLVDHEGEISAANPLPVTATELWRTALIANEALNDSDKSFTVPANTEWQILWIWIEFTSTAVVGNRQLEVQVLDNAADVIGVLGRASVVQTASLTRNYLFAPGVADLLGFRDTDYLSTPLPVTTFLSAGNVLRVFDNNAVDAAADDMVVQIQYASRTV